MTDSFDFDQFLETQITLPFIADDVIEPVQPQIELPLMMIKKREGELMKTFLKYNKLTQQHLDVYNQFVRNMANIISAKQIPVGDGRIVRIINIKIDKPSYKMENQERILYPSYARKNYKTYDAAVTGDLVVVKNNKTIYTSKMRVLVMRLPVMLFSMLCHLENKTPTELIELGEDPIEQGGYFIVEGVEKIIMLEEKLSTNRIFIMHSSPKIKKYKTAIKLTTNTTTGTSMNELIYNVNDIMKYSFQPLRKKKDQKKVDQFEKTKKINIIYLFQLFSIMYLNKTYCYDNHDIMNLIMTYLTDVKILAPLYPSFAALDSMNNKKTKPLTAMEVIVKKANLTALSDKDKEEEVKKLLKSVFGHLEDIDPNENELKQDYALRIIKSKINLLAIMAAKYLNYLSGSQPLDDRDDWANKRVEGPGRKMEQLTRIAWNKITKQIVDTQLRDQMDNQEIEKVFHSTTVNDNMNKIFRDSFINSKWGPKGGNQKNNATQSLNRDNMVATLSHISTINVNIQRTDKKIEIRLKKSSEWRYVCLARYSEGSNCGLVKNLAITTKISLDHGIEGDRIIQSYITTTIEKTIINQHIMMLNGKYLGWCQGPETRKRLLTLRRQNAIHYDTSLYIDNLYLYVDSSPSRLLSPVLIVDESTQQLVLDLKQITDFRPENLIDQGAMEYISAWEEQNLKIAEDVKTLHERTRTMQQYQRELLVAKQNNSDDVLLLQQRFDKVIKTNKPYTHCEISGRAALGVAADMIPFFSHNQPARNIFTSSMITQAVGNYHLNYKSRFDGTVKVLESPTPAIVKTAIYDTLGLNQRGMGQNIIIAFMASPGTEEDAFIFNQGSIDRGLFRMVKYFTYQGKIKMTDPNIKSSFAKPPLNKDESEERYKHLNEHGLPIIGSFINEGECVIGIVKERNGKRYNQSIFLNHGDKGVVDDIHFHETPMFEIIEVKLRITRLPERGDKYAARFAQKGTVGKIVPYHEMPFSELSGMVPDVIVNTTVIPSRMTVSYLMELLAGKAAAMFGETVDASAFQEADMDVVKQKLRDVGFNDQGYETLRDGQTGRRLDAAIYMGVVYFQALKHQPVDKMSVRSEGPLTSATRQPVKGRQRGGGLRFGEMESDTLKSHGASATVKERLCNVSDKYVMSMCQCGTTAVYNAIEKKFYCPVCTSDDVKAVTLPYVMKYHNHMLNAMGFKQSFVLSSQMLEKQPTLKIEDADIESDEENEEALNELNEQNECNEEELGGSESEDEFEQVEEEEEYEEEDLDDFEDDY